MVIKKIMGTKLIATLPDGRWTLVKFGETLLAVSPEHQPIIVEPDDTLKTFELIGHICPHCGDSKSRVDDSRARRGGIYRRRECAACHFRFTTVEHIDAKIHFGLDSKK